MASEQDAREGDDAGVEQFPIEVNGHRVSKTVPTFPMVSGTIEWDPKTAFKCSKCGHEMQAPKNRIENAKWVKNAFDCVECVPDGE